MSIESINNNSIDPVNETVTETPIDPNNSIVIEEAIEAILFAAGHPITYATLAKVFETTPSKIKDIVFDYAPVGKAAPPQPPPFTSSPDCPEQHPL